jgi:hypothetical protein
MIMHHKKQREGRLASVPRLCATHSLVNWHNCSASCRDPRVELPHADRRCPRRCCQSHSGTLRCPFTPETHLVSLAQS